MDKILASIQITLGCPIRDAITELYKRSEMYLADQGREENLSSPEVVVVPASEWPTWSIASSLAF